MSHDGTVRNPLPSGMGRFNYQQYLGKPFSAYGNCLNFFIVVQKEEFNRDIPNTPGEISKYFEPTETGAEGDLLLMKNGHRLHVGIMVQDKYCLHNFENLGVILTPIKRLKEMGLIVTRYYKYSNGHI